MILESHEAYDPACNSFNAFNDFLILPSLPVHMLIHASGFSPVAIVSDWHDYPQTILYNQSFPPSIPLAGIVCAMKQDSPDVVHYQGAHRG